MPGSRWLEALNELAPLARVHAGPDTGKAYRMLADRYSGTEVFGYPTGSRVGTWEAPFGWAVRVGRLIDPRNEVVADYSWHPLYLYAFSPSFRGRVSRQELERHLMSDPDRPDAIPFHFRNQYRPHEAEWGFCLPHRVREGLIDGDYDVEIDTVFSESQLEMAMQTHKGDKADSILFVGHFDHPAQVGDGLIGCLAGHEAVTRIASRRTHLTYRMLSTIEIVGSVFYAVDRARRDGIREGLFTATAGVRGPLIYSRTVNGSALIDRALTHVLRYSDEEARIVPFGAALGNDEIAYEVQGIDIPCGSLMRWPYADYHTSADTPDKIDAHLFEGFVRLLLRTIDVFEQNAYLVGRFEGLPQLARPGIDLYLPPATVSGIDIHEADNATVRELMARLPDDETRRQAARLGGNYYTMMRAIPPLADGRHTTLDIAERIDVPFPILDAYTDMWVDRGLLEKRWWDPFEPAGK